MTDQILSKKLKIKGVLAAWTYVLSKAARTTIVGLVLDDVLLEKDALNKTRTELKAILREYESENNTHINLILINYSEIFMNMVAEKADVFSQLSLGTILFDDCFILSPLKALLFSGELEGSKEALIYKKIKIGQMQEDLKNHKSALIFDISQTFVSLAQSILIAKKHSIPTHKLTSHALSDLLVKEKIINPQYSETLKTLFALMKELEKDSNKEIEFGVIDKYLKELHKFAFEIREIYEK